MTIYKIPLPAPMWTSHLCEGPCVSVLCMRTSETAQLIMVYLLKIQHASNSHVSSPMSTDVELFLCLIYWLYFNYLFILLCQVSLVKGTCDWCNWYSNIMSPLHNLSKYTFNLSAQCVLYIRTGVSLLLRERFLYI